MNELLKEFYMRTYPTDDLGQELDDRATFQDLFNALDTYKCVYNLFGVGDSIIRERLFERLAFLLGTDYDYVYEQWLLGARIKINKIDKTN